MGALAVGIGSGVLAGASSLLANSQKDAAMNADYRKRKELHDSLVKQAETMRTEIRNDPAGWLVSNDDSVQSAQIALAQNPSAEAWQNYSVAMRAAKERRGITDAALLPKQQAQAMADKFSQSKEPAQDLAQWQAALGPDYPAVMKQIMPKASAEMQILANDMPENAVKLWAKSRNDPDFRKNAETMLTQNGLDKKEFETSVHTACADMINSLNAGGNFQLSTGLVNVVTTLAYAHMLAGRSQDEAVDRAARAAFADKYDFGANLNGSQNFRIPKTVNQSGEIAAGAAGYLQTADVEGFQRQFDPRLDKEGQNKIDAAIIRRNAVWVTNKDESGLQLFVGANPVLDKNGKPVNLTWEQVASYAPVANSENYSPDEY